jgi:uncharacterized repeat protein (TIGR01451 family)
MKKSLLILSVATLFFSMTMQSQEEKAFHFTPDTTYLPDGTGVSYTTSIFVSGYVAGQTLSSLNEFLGVCVNMEHSFLGDIDISLTCPNNTTIVLENQGGGGANLGIPNQGDNTGPGAGYDYCWNQNPEFGVMSEVAGSNQTLPAGSYTSFQALSDLIGCPLNGDWTITVTDHMSVDDGYIFNWGINFAANPGCFTMLTGQIYADMNTNGVFDETDFPLPGISLQAEPGPYYGITDTDGFYRIWVDQGTYAINQLGVNSPWEQAFPASPDYHVVQVLTNEYDTISNLDFSNIASSYCPEMSVDVVLGGLGICSYPTIYVNYENSGTISSENTTIAVELDENLTYQSGGNLISQVGNLLTFDVGIVGIGQSGQFTFTTHYSCEPDLAGATACVSAHIYPDDPCEEVSTEWDRSSVSVDGQCVGDLQVCFTITNTGDPGEGDMDGTSEYRIYDDNILVYVGSFQIAGGEELEICWPALGTTIRLEADQRPFHPGNSHPQESIENCGSPDNSQGQILVVPQDDEDEFVEIDCEVVLAAYDPNDKAVVPQGLLAQHFIDTTDVLEYKIRFQNTGTAPAINIIVTDTISEFLDVAKFEHMSSSHPCTVDILYSNIIRWTFSNIMLPDSTNNEPESHGYIKFKIGQMPGNYYGDLITNSAAIYFDYNLPVITNTVFNTIGKMGDITSPAPIVYAAEGKVNVYPNPSNSFVSFEVNSDNYSIDIISISGQKVRSIYGITSPVYTMQRSGMANGIYFYSISDSKGKIASGKLIFEE